MKSIFEESTRVEVIKRIRTLTPESTASWGSMTVGQMVRHCAICEAYYYGDIRIKRSFAGRIFGKKAIKAILKDENSGLHRNAPTAPPFRVTEEVIDLESEKRKWVALIERYATFNQELFTHWFFGRMSKEQLGQFIYKHTHHHLVQFQV